MTPHIKAKKTDFAKVVLMPGDPLRAKWIAENFLEEVEQINEIRGMLAFTGTYKGHKVSIMGHGMGIPSIGIYSYELYKFFDVETIIRIGSAGAYKKEVQVGSVALTKEATSESTYADLLNVKTDNNVLYPSKEINTIIEKTAKELNINLLSARIHSSDVFYGVRTVDEIVKKTNADLVEMESFALFANAKLLNKKAACLLTCSDSLVTHEAMSAEDRQTKFVDMVKLALESAIKI
ncbi:purine-nucleoside phosphorylase [Malacoplasma iowae]|uniref:Uridine phosphorylase n=2 Tax=Malacoplasma iowae TaxID=2116 RepID=A0A084U426_MALIO|nr:purine-nucleoside phosphorylase [Malacoplasma iowae]VEU61912.1 Purine nucleoside phosphorylase [Mycoplasmopsis fermentans]EGZ31093.1 purine nucleoside phosphorylase [Malacoplasma iowae 695]KFB07712.1 purine nucleoside phosphorylase [Malacoplasma iowae DK-CPA]QHG90067.1 purine-nucleoside phosphorylase [Malacoplasma iowae 695]WPL36200.1 purine-nucleoside phosphorylase [Malacoplasma iowae]